MPTIRVVLALSILGAGACGGDDFEDSKTTGGAGGAGASGAGGSGADGGATDGGGGAGASGGTGGGLVCEPGSMADCYTGPAGTQDVGPCKAGAHICNADGSGYGECIGEELPAAMEDCGTPIDDDCSGNALDVCPCVPGEVQGCYTGPIGTQDVGACVGGTQTCNADGLGYGPCMNEVVPQPEDCVNFVDDDCDFESDEAADGCVCHPGDTQPCYTGPGGTENVGVCKGGMQSCSADGKAFSPTCAGEVVPSTEVCHDTTDEDCNGAECAAPLFVKLFGAGGTQSANGVTFDTAGNIYVVGTYELTLDLGGGVTHTSAGGQDVFVLKLGPAGNLLWSKSFGTSGVQQGFDVAASSTHVAIVGTFETGITLGGSSYVAGANVQKGFVAKLTQTDGTPVWSAEIAVEPNSNTANSVAFDAAGDVIVAGYHKDIGFPFSNVLVRKYAGANGSVVWGKSYGDSSGQFGFDLATDSASNILVVGMHAGSMTIAPCNALSAGAVQNAFVAKLAPNGDCVWASQFGDAANIQAATGVAVDPSNNVVLSGTHDGSVSCGGASLTSQGGSDIFVCKLGPNGSHVWSKSFGSAADAESGGRVAADATAVFVLGTYAGTVNLGGPNLPPPLGSLDVFLAKLDSQGNHVWSKGFVSSTVVGEQATGVATYQGMSAITGTGVGTNNWGTGPLMSSGGSTDALVAKYDP